MPAIKQIIQAIVGLILLAVFLYIAAHLLVVAIFIAVAAVAVIAARKFLIEKGIISRGPSQADAQDISLHVTTIEGDFKEVKTPSQKNEEE